MTRAPLILRRRDLDFLLAERSEIVAACWTTLGHLLSLLGHQNLSQFRL
jgi:hypothetical protein